MAPIPVTENSDEEYQKKVVVKKDLAKIKWRHIKPKRGYRNGIYPNWSRLRNKVYKNKSFKNPFQNSLRTSVDRIRVSVSSDPVHPVHLTRTKSSSSVLPLRPPNGHDHWCPLHIDGHWSVPPVSDCRKCEGCFESSVCTQHDTLRITHCSVSQLSRILSVHCLLWCGVQCVANQWCFVADCRPSITWIIRPYSHSHSHSNPLLVTIHSFNYIDPSGGPKCWHFIQCIFLLSLFCFVFFAVLFVRSSRPTTTSSLFLFEE